MIDAGNKELLGFTTSCGGAQFPAQEWARGRARRGEARREGGGRWEGEEKRRTGKFFVARSATKRIPERSSFFSPPFFFFPGRIIYRPSLARMPALK